MIHANWGGQERTWLKIKRSSWSCSCPAHSHHPCDVPESDFTFESHVIDSRVAALPLIWALPLSTRKMEAYEMKNK